MTFLLKCQAYPFRMLFMDVLSFHHLSVLLTESIDALNIKPNGTYVDCTTGGAGHSQAILSCLDSDGTLICFDQDQEALQVAKARLAALKCPAKLILIHRPFGEIKAALTSLNIAHVDGILADLGVSSFQLDEARRGFSYMHNGPLDMRMNQHAAVDAAALLANLSEEALVRIFKQYGEENHAHLIARAIVQQRQTKPLLMTSDLTELIFKAIPNKARKEKQHPAKRVFQALRIAVNQELDQLEQLLQDGLGLLKPGGRFALISFHSLEDRLIKQTFKQWEQPCICPSHLPCVCGLKPLGRLVDGRKGIVASADEIKHNPRARSARLRVFERNEEVFHESAKR